MERIWSGYGADMRQEHQDQTCYARDCAASAEFRCARCGKACCAQHVRHVRLERRDEPDERLPERIRLTRVPSHVRAYSFCLRCKA